MLSVSKKAASEAECRAICAESYAEETPFGRPVIIVDAKQFPPAKSLFSLLTQPPVKTRARNHIFEKMTAILKKDLNVDAFAVDKMYLYNEAVVERMANVVSISNHMVSENITDGLANECDFPSCSVIVCNKGTNAAKSLCERPLGILKKDLPGYDSQWHTMVLWHEIGHACRGLSEAKADQLAALVCRYAFEDFSFLSAWADFRAIDPIVSFEYNNAQLAHTYPASGAFIIDEVVKREKDPTWQDIEDTVVDPRKLKETCSIEESILFAKKLKQQAPRALKCRDLFALAVGAQQLLKEDRFESRGEFLIAARFTMAALRLWAGKDGYPKSGTTPGPTPA